MEHGAAVGVVGAIVVGLHRRHGVVFSGSFAILFLQVLQNKDQENSQLCAPNITSFLFHSPPPLQHCSCPQPTAILSFRSLLLTHGQMRTTQFSLSTSSPSPSRTHLLCILTPNYQLQISNWGAQKRRADPTTTDIF